MVVYGEYGPSSTLNGKYSHLTMTRDCNPGIPESRKFSNPKIPGLSRTQSRDFGINKIYLFNGFLVLFKIILCIYSFLHSLMRFSVPSEEGRDRAVLLMLGPTCARTQ